MKKEIVTPRERELAEKFNLDSEVRGFIELRLRLQKCHRPAISYPPDAVIEELQKDLIGSIIRHAEDLDMNLVEGFVRGVCRLCTYKLVRERENRYRHSIPGKPQVNEELAGLMADAILLQLEKKRRMKGVEIGEAESGEADTKIQAICRDLDDRLGQIMERLNEEKEKRCQE